MRLNKLKISASALAIIIVVLGIAFGTDKARAFLLLGGQIQVSTANLAIDASNNLMVDGSNNLLADHWPLRRSKDRLTVLKISAFLLLLAAVLLPATAHAAACSPAIGTYGCFNVFSTPHTFTGSNASSGLNSAAPDTSACPSGAGTLTPVASIEQCVLSGNLIMAPPSTVVPVQPILEILAENGTGGFTVSPCTACEFPGSQINSDGTVAISTTALAENDISCNSVAISTNKMHCTVTAGLTSPGAFTVGTVVESSTAGTTGMTSLAVPSVPITSGHYLLAPVYSCAGGSGCSSSNTPSAPTSVSVASGTGTLGTCSLLSGITIHAGAPNYIPVSGLLICPITGSGTANLTVTIPTGDFAHAFAFDVGGLATPVDEGVGNEAGSSSNVTSPSVATNGTPTQASNFMVAAFGGVGSVSAGTGWTMIAQDVSNGLMVEWQISNSPSAAVTATAGQAANPFDALIGALK